VGVRKYVRQGKASAVAEEAVQCVRTALRYHQRVIYSLIRPLRTATEKCPFVVAKKIGDDASAWHLLCGTTVDCRLLLPDELAEAAAKASARDACALSAGISEIDVEEKPLDNRPSYFGRGGDGQRARGEA